MSTKEKNRGFTLAELMIAVSIFVAVGLVLTLFEKNIFSYNYYIQADLGAQMEGRRAVTKMVAEMREMSQSSLGSYPIAVAATSTITFYTDIDADAIKEQIRYYVQGAKIYKSVIKPTGNPLVYNAGSAVVTTVTSGLANGTSTPLFEYYDSNFAGTSTPLTLPVNILSIRLIKMNILLPIQASISGAPLQITSAVVPRNLKNNL